MKHTARAYTLAELLVALGILAIFLTLFLSVVSASFRTVRTVQSRTDAQQKARVAMNYIRDRLAQASSFTPGVELHDFYRSRPPSFTQSPFLSPYLCDFNGPPNWASQGSQPPNPDNRITLYDTGKITRPSPSVALLHFMQDPLCLGDPVPPVRITLPNGTTLGINENPDQGYPAPARGPASALATIYRTELEDLNKDGDFDDPIEQYLRTLVFEVRSPSAASWGPSTCLAGTTGNRNAKVDREIVTLAHTWKEKVFWQDDDRDGVVDPFELRVEDFVLYERKTRYFEDPTRNLDVNCDGRVTDADEVARVAEVPLVSGIIDVIFQLIDSRGNEILPCIGSCSPPAGLPEFSNRDYKGEFICYPTTEYYDPAAGQLQTNNEHVGVPFSGAPGWGACRRVDRVRVTVVAGSDEAIRLIRKTMDSNGIPFQDRKSVDPEEIGALDYLGLFSNLYQKGSLVILQEEVHLNLLGG